MNIQAEISGIKYCPLLCRTLKVYSFEDLGKALDNESSFTLRFDTGAALAVSWWVSPKRTRSYPYARVYDTLNFQGKRVTVIPVLKDEGRAGDRDFLQWDTVSLMSLQGVYVVIGYYSRAERSARCADKITRQRFDLPHLRVQLKDLLFYQSDALHWNLSQAEQLPELSERALSACQDISEHLGVPMHSFEGARKRVDLLKQGREIFIGSSRGLARQAQRRETVTVQPKERLGGAKASLTIRNYLGGEYYLTCDEVYPELDTLYLVEGKHSSRGSLPSLEDIKDGLLRMVLFCNLKRVWSGGREYRPRAVLKLTGGEAVSLEALMKEKAALLGALLREAEMNGVEVWRGAERLKTMADAA